MSYGERKPESGHQSQGVGLQDKVVDSREDWLVHGQGRLGWTPCRQLVHSFGSRESTLTTAHVPVGRCYLQQGAHLYTALVDLQEAR